MVMTFLLYKCVDLFFVASHAPNRRMDIHVIIGNHIQNFSMSKIYNLMLQAVANNVDVKCFQSALTRLMWYRLHGMFPKSVWYFFVAARNLQYTPVAALIRSRCFCYKLMRCYYKTKCAMFSFKALQFSHWLFCVFIVHLLILLWQLEACFL